VVRCPKCGAEVDVDEDEVEEGEIVSCLECESDLEVVQTHPVHLNIISEDEDDDEDDDPDTGADSDDDLDDDEEEDEEDDEE